MCHCDLHKVVPSIPRLGVRRLNRSRLDVAAWLSFTHPCQQPYEQIPLTTEAVRLLHIARVA
jgi:hypothetical protein